jgi:fructose-bisphosphate aldolase, class I
MDLNALKTTAKAMVAPGKGILAADESASTSEKRFASVNVPCTEENRRQYRDLFLAAPGVEQFISGVILHEETISQKATDGTPFPELLNKKGIIPGIKVDKGTKDLALHPGEKITEGLDGLRERMTEFGKLGAKFAKWRAVITIGNGIPTDACIRANAHALARYAAICQDADIVPMVEPEVLIDGEHSLEKSYEVTVKTLKVMFEEMKGQDVAFPGAILKASMVIAGKSAAKQSTPKEVAEMTIKCLKEAVPADLAGVVFLSGGQTDEQSTANLNEMNKIGGTPWPLSFSYARALQSPALKIWGADITKNVSPARDAFLFRAKMNGLAAAGKYEESMEATKPY